MIVDTVKEKLSINKLVSSKKEIIFVEGDMIVPDSKPDILNTICTSGMVCIYKKVVLTDLARDDMAEAIEDAFRYDRMILASPTYDMSLFPDTEKFLRRLKHKNYQNRKVAIIQNGSWAPASGKLMKDLFSEMKNIEIVEPIVTIKTRMTEETEKQMEELVKNICKRG